MLRVVVLGTGTGVGKTRFSELLIRALCRRISATVGGVKPVETGYRGERDGRPPPGSDAAALERVSRCEPPRPHPLYAFPDPVSPHLAARRARSIISVPQIQHWVTLPYAICIVETAGGAFSPLTQAATNADLALALDPSVWILVAPDSLGVLHDVRATWTALVSHHRAPDFLVLTAARRPDVSTGTNARELERLGLPRPAAVVPRGGRSTAPLDALARALVERARLSSRPGDDRRRAASGAPRAAPRTPRRGSR